MALIDKQYNKLLETILRDGFHYTDASRDNVAMLQIPSYTLTIDMEKGFPLLTTKRIYWKTCAHEFIWMLKGTPSIQYLKDRNVKIWDADVANYDKEKGLDAGRIYGVQWRDWTNTNGENIDQLERLITRIKDGGLYSRRNLVVAWNPAELSEMALPPCHWGFEVIPMSNGFEDRPGFMLKWYQRSVDVFLGLPFDIVLYAFMGKMIESLTGYKFMTLEAALSNIHIYGPHLPQVNEQLSRTPIDQEAHFYWANYIDLHWIDIEDFKVENYKYHPPIKANLITKA